MTEQSGTALPLSGPLAETPDSEIHDYGDQPDYPDDQRNLSALKLPERLRPPCPRGCVDVEGCGCDWNVEREAWPNGSALPRDGRDSLFPFRRRCLWRHDYKLVSGVPEYPELRANGRRKLYKMIEVCERCGSQR